MFNPWKLKSEMCEVGRRMHAQGLVASFEGDLSARLGPDRILCTSSLVSKGFLKPEDLATVDMAGNQIAGPRPRTSDILLHLAVYRERPDVAAVVHAHPPHATAFAVAHEPIPGCLQAEFEVFLGEVPMAPYATPGTQEFADTVVPLLPEASAILLANHGTVSFGKSLEEALFRSEILESYCRIVWLSRQLGPPRPLTPENIRELLRVKERLGLRDRRAGLKDADSPPGGAVGRPGGVVPAPGAGTDLEALVRDISDRVWGELGRRAAALPVGTRDGRAR